MRVTLPENRTCARALHGGRREQSDHRLATVELADGQHREERGGHAEDHRDEVDHERRLDQTVMHDVAEPFDHRLAADAGKVVVDLRRQGFIATAAISIPA